MSLTEYMGPELDRWAVLAEMMAWAFVLVPAAAVWGLA